MKNLEDELLWQMKDLADELLWQMSVASAVSRDGLATGMFWSQVCWGDGPGKGSWVRLAAQSCNRETPPTIPTQKQNQDSTGP